MMPKRYPEHFIQIMSELKRYPLVYEDEDQEKAVKAGLSSIAAKPLQVRVEATEAKQLRPWSPPKPLKQQIMEDERPQAGVYKRLIKAWPDIADSKLREILEGTPRERIEKTLAIYEACGRLFTEFIEPNLTHEQILMLDKIYLYYELLEEARGRRLLDGLDDGLEYKVAIDNKTYKASLYAFLDGQRASLNFYPDEFNRPKLGIPYRDWPCLQKIKEAVRRRAENLAIAIKELKLNKDELANIQAEIDHIRELENSFLPLGIESFIYLPPKYVVKDGLLGPYIYVNRITLPCGLCGKQHSIWLIAKVR